MRQVGKALEEGCWRWSSIDLTFTGSRLVDEVLGEHLQRESTGVQGAQKLKVESLVASSFADLLL